MWIILWPRMFKLKVINKIMIYWKKNCIISTEGLRYERYILFILILPTKVFPFTNHVFVFFFQRMFIDILFSNKIQICF